MIFLNVSVGKNLNGSAVCFGLKDMKSVLWLLYKTIIARYTFVNLK